MSEPDHFLKRWSRRKHLAGEEHVAPEPNAAEVNAPATSETASSDMAAAQTPPAVSPEPEFDPGSLPSLDSIGADTDISPFLKKGVPSELRHAALRRAWSADPAISEFKGLQENDWNFNDPNGIPGFGELNPTTDIKKMLGDLFGDTRRDAEAAAEQPETAEDVVPQSQDLTATAGEAARRSTNELKQPKENSDPADFAGTDSGDMLHRNTDIVSQEPEPEPGTDGLPAKRRRGHGGALPQ